MEQVAEQLKAVPELLEQFDVIKIRKRELTHSDGLSFSDPSVASSLSGGQFLRAYVERHNGLPIRNLTTFGSQHMGIADTTPYKPRRALPSRAQRGARRRVQRM